MLPAAPVSMLLITCVAQTLLSFHCAEAGPVRFGFPLPASKLARGLRAEGPEHPRLQWRVLQERPDPATGRLWVELAVAPARGQIRIVAGGVAARPGPAGPVYELHVESRDDGGDHVTVRTWQWCDGTLDREERRVLGAARDEAGERWAAGEARTTCDAGASRWTGVRIPRVQLERAGILPAREGLAATLRRELVDTARALVELPGARGAGDYARAGGVVTNHEFDTLLGLTRLGLDAAEPELLAKAWRGLRHLLDHDLDPTTGLPFRHSLDHRGAPPEPGHVWLQGPLLVACLAADDEALARLRSVARGLAGHPALGRAQLGTERWHERARDWGWPLWELESWLRFADDEACAAAADRLALELRGRFDTAAATWRFGEGEAKPGLYAERCWITGGILLPALAAHLRRRPDPELAQQIEQARTRLFKLCSDGGVGLPVRVWLHDGQPEGAQRLVGRAELVLLLEGLHPQQRARLLQRGTVEAALRGIPARDDPDLATQFSIAARCRWILQ